MGEDTNIYVKKEQARELYFAAEKILFFGNRWAWFKGKLFLDEYPKGRCYFTAEEILSECAGKEVKTEIISVIKDLIGKDCIIQGDYIGFPEDKDEKEYVDLTGIFYMLWDKMFDTEKSKENKER